MALTPADVEGKTFGTALRGYDLDEVDDFLDDVVGTLRGLQDQLAEARAVQPETTAPAVVADESAVGRALIAAQAAADTILSDARTEAERIVDEARDEAETWVSERDAKKAEADVEMAELTGHVSNVRTQLAVLATAVADRLDEMDQTIIGSVEPTATGDVSGEDDTLVDLDEEVETFDLGDSDVSDGDQDFTASGDSEDSDEVDDESDGVINDNDPDDASDDATAETDDEDE